MMGAYGTPIWGEGGVVGVSDGTIGKSDSSFLQALHCDRCAICNHSAGICDRMSPTLKSTGGWVTLCPNLGVVPLEQTRHVGVAKSERHSLTNGGIIFEEFQPM